MLDLVGEVFKCAKRNCLFRRIDYVSITDGGVRNYDLGMAFCPKGSTLKQGLLIPNALGIDILPGFDVVNSIHNETDSSPELIIEVVLRILANF